MPKATADQLEEALDEVVTALFEHRESRRGKPQRDVTSSYTLKTLDHMEVNQLVRDPIGVGMKHAIRQLGKALYEQLGSIRAMQDIADRVAGRVPEHEARRMSPIDAAWNGIGSGDDRWWT